MAKFQDLMALIQRLDKAERRHFRIRAQWSGGQKNYLALFDYYSNNPDTDLPSAKRHFSQHRFSQQLHVCNTYLYDLLLDSLSRVHRETSVDHKIRNCLNETEVLFQKELLSQCEKRLRQAEELATQFERLPLLAEIYVWQRKILITRNAAQESSTLLTDWIDKDYQNHARLAENHFLWRELIELSHQYAGRARQRKTTGLKKSSINLARQSTNRQGHLLQLHIDYAHAVRQNRLADALYAVSALIHSLEELPDWINQDPNPYVTAINNKIGFLLYGGNQADIPPLFKKIHQLQTKYKLKNISPSLSRQLLRSYNIELEYHRNNRDSRTGFAMIEPVNEFLSKNTHIVPKDYYVMFYYQFAFFSFQEHHYQISLQWLMQIQKLPPAKARLDIQAQAKLLSLLLYYQTKQMSVLRYSVDNIRRFLKKHSLLTEYANILLRLFSRLSTQPATKHLDIFCSTYSQIQQLEKPQLSLDQTEQCRWLAQQISRLDKATLTKKTQTT